MRHVLALLIFVIGATAMSGVARAADPACERRELQGRKVVICTLDTTRQSVRTYWLDRTGTPYGSLSGIDRRAADQPGAMLFAMNAGMYHEDLSPVGLYVEAGKQLHKPSTAGGPGNFHMRPNGVFYVTGRTVGVSETRRYLAKPPAADFASQSGPMLVIDGKLHPKFTGEGTSAKIRNGVGVRGTSTAFFVISEEPVTFTEFAKMFRDDLKCRNALYFDGSISSLYAPSVNRSDSFMRLGPIVAGFAR